MQSRGAQKARITYDKHSRLYDGLFHGLLRVGEPVNAVVKNHQYLDRPGMNVLDAGCGSGLFTHALMDHDRNADSARFHAFDISQAMLNRFQRENQQRGVMDLEMLTADATTMTLPEYWPKFDLIVSCGMVEHLKSELPLVCDKLLQHLAPGGKLVLFMARDNMLTRPLLQSWGAQGLDPHVIKAALKQSSHCGQIEEKLIPGKCLSIEKLANHTNYVIEVTPKKV